MKALLYIGMIFFASLACAGERPVQPGLSSVSGEVLEVNSVQNYTYLLLKTAKGEKWAAVNRAEVSKGDRVTIENAMVMKDFESRSLKRTFKTILFGTLAGAHAAQPAPVEDIHVAKAAGDNAVTVEEVATKRTELKDKQVQVRGKIVKYTPAILGKNWVHLRDGSGAEGSNDLLVTTTDQARAGDIVTVTGVVHTDRDFGSGYTYKVLIEDAALRP